MYYQLPWHQIAKDLSILFIHPYYFRFIFFSLRVFHLKHPKLRTKTILSFEPLTTPFVLFDDPIFNKWQKIRLYIKSPNTSVSDTDLSEHLTFLVHKSVYF